METNDGIISLLTIGYFMNTTALNQGNHCIITYNVTRPVVEGANQALLTTEAQCQKLQNSLQQQLQALANLFFNQQILNGFGG